MRIAALLALAFAGGVYPITAQAQDRTSARDACMADYKKYCSGVMPGGGRVKKCLSENIDKLAPDCRSAVEAKNGGATKN